MSNKEDLFVTLMVMPWLLGLAGFPVTAVAAGYLWDGLDPNSPAQLLAMWLGSGLLLTLAGLARHRAQRKRRGAL